MKETQAEGLGTRGSDSVATLAICRFTFGADKVRKQEQLVVVEPPSTQGLLLVFSEILTIPTSGIYTTYFLLA